MRVLLIHGRAQGGKDPDVLRQQWLGALRAGFDAAGEAFPAQVAFDFPFYGDALDRFVDQAELPTSADVASKGPGGSAAFEEFLRSSLVEMEAAHPGIVRAEVDAELADDDVAEKGPGNWRWVHAVATVIDRHLGGVADFTIDRFLTDVYVYLTNRNIKRAINQIVFDHLTDEPTIVVGHSLGSVVGYEVIEERGDQLDLVKHITVGSPLGLKTITAKLGRPANRARHGWFNAHDPDDIVALAPLDRDHFPTTPPIVNDGSVRNHTHNQHGIVGYLDHAAVAAAVAEALSID